MKGFSQFFVFWFRKFNILVFYDFQLNLDGNDMIGEFIIQILISVEFMLLVVQIIIKILGRFGKMIIGCGSNLDIDVDKVQVMFDEVKEIDSSGNLVGVSGVMKYSFNIFVSFDFIFFVLEDILFVGIIVKRLNFIVNIESVNVMFIVLVYIFINGGVIFIDGEKLIVIVGIIKFNIQIEGWQFCGNFGVICM